MMNIFAKIGAVLTSILVFLSFQQAPISSPEPSGSPVEISSSPTSNPIVTASPLPQSPTPKPVLTPAPKIEDIVTQVQELTQIIASYTPEPTPTPQIIYVPQVIYVTVTPTPYIPTPTPTPTPPVYLDPMWICKDMGNGWDVQFKIPTGNDYPYRGRMSGGRVPMSGPESIDWCQRHSNLYSI